MQRVIVFVSLVLCGLNLSWGASWKIDQAQITSSGGTHSLNVKAISGENQTVTTLNVEAPISAISESFVVGDKLVVLGNAGKTEAVIVLNLKESRKEDWFYCYQPRNLENRWVIYVEYYPAHGAGEPTDVVLLYDATADASHNRLMPPSSNVESDRPNTIQVGLPLYPEWNVKQRSYGNSVEDVTKARHVLGPPFFLYLHPSRIAFVASEGYDMSDYRNYLVVVNISKGIDKPDIKYVDFPKSQLKRPGEHPNFVRITALKEIDHNTIELAVPEDDYGVKKISMKIP